MLQEQVKCQLNSRHSQEVVRLLFPKLAFLSFHTRYDSTRQDEAQNLSLPSRQFGIKSWFAGKRTKMSTAAPAQYLRRIVFSTYVFFFESQIQKRILPGTGVWNFFNKCQFVGKRQKIKGWAIKCFLFGSKSWLKEVGSVLPYRQNCAISSDETFVSMSPKVRGWMVTFTDYFFGRNLFSTFLFLEANFSCDTLWTCNKCMCALPPCHLAEVWFGRKMVIFEFC